MDILKHEVVPRKIRVSAKHKIVWQRNFDCQIRLYNATYHSQEFRERLSTKDGVLMVGIDHTYIALISII